MEKDVENDKDEKRLSKNNRQKATVLSDDV